MNLLSPIESVIDAAANAWDMTPLGGGVADMTPTPSTVIDRLNEALQNAMEDRTLLKVWADGGTTPYPKEQRTPVGAAAYLKKEIAHWGAVVRDNKIEPPAN